jgi:hypothetical protein
VLVRVDAVASVFQRTFRNPTLRRVGFAYALFTSAELGIWIALLVFAYGHGEASAGTLIAFIQLVPCNCCPSCASIGGVRAAL